MLRQSIFHVLFFVVFFSLGAAALGVAVLCDDFIQYCRNKHLVQEAESSVKRLKSLNADYDGLLEELESNPDLLKRIAPVTLGTQPNDPCAIYPKARAEELAVARKALVTQEAEEEADATDPGVAPAVQRADQEDHPVHRRGRSGPDFSRVLHAGAAEFGSLTVPSTPNKIDSWRAKSLAK